MKKLVVLENKTTKVKWKNPFLATTSLDWFKGLMFSSKKILIFDFKEEQKIDIHMFFVFFPIFAIALNSNKRVIKFKKMLPFVSFFRFRGRYLIEIPSDWIKDIDLNHQFEWR